MVNCTIFLGSEVIHTNDDLFLTQSRYASDLLKQVSMSDCKPVSTPISVSYNLRNCEHITLLSYDITSYHSILGALQYLTTTRIDLTFSINLVSQFMYSPSIVHEALKRVL